MAYLSSSLYPLRTSSLPVRFGRAGGTGPSSVAPPSPPGLGTKAATSVPQLPSSSAGNSLGRTLGRWLATGLKLAGAVLLPAGGYVYREPIAKMAATLPLPHLPQGAATSSPAKQVAQTAKSLWSGMQKVAAAGVSLLGVLGVGVLVLKGRNAERPLAGEQVPVNNVNTTPNNTILPEQATSLQGKITQAQQRLRDIGINHTNSSGNMFSFLAGNRGNKLQEKINITKELLQDQEVQNALQAVEFSPKEKTITYDFGNIGKYVLKADGHPDLTEYRVLRKMYKNGSAVPLPNAIVNDFRCIPNDMSGKADESWEGYSLRDKDTLQAADSERRKSNFKNFKHPAISPILERYARPDNTSRKKNASSSASNSGSSTQPSEQQVMLENLIELFNNIKSASKHTLESQITTVQMLFETPGVPEQLRNIRLSEYEGGYRDPSRYEIMYDFGDLGDYTIMVNHRNDYRQLRNFYNNGNCPFPGRLNSQFKQVRARGVYGKESYQRIKG